jgi:hypothetical protein
MQPINPDISILGMLDGLTYGVIHGVFRNGEQLGTWVYVCDLPDWRDHPDHEAIIEAREREIRDLQARIAELNVEAERTRAVMARWMREAPPEAPSPSPRSSAWTCAECGASFATEMALRKHSQSACPASTFVCECGVRCKSAGGLRVHRSKHCVATPQPTPEPQPEAFACDECDRTFRNQHALNMHRVRQHSERRVTLDMSPFSAAAVAATLATPENEHEFQCSQCGSQGPASLKRIGLCVRCSKAQEVAA